MSVIDTLIFDRTADDVANRTKKGYYNAEDLNRVRSAMEYVRDLLAECGFNIKLSEKRVWYEGDVPNTAEMRNYISDVSKLKNALSLFKETPQAPSSMNRLTWSKANDIEKILSDIDIIVSSMLKIRVRCAQTVLFCGNVYYMVEVERALVDASGAMILTSDGRGIILRQN